MLATVPSAVILGATPHPLRVEVDVAHGLPQFAIVGLPDAAVRESRDRVRAAIRNSAFEFPPHRITVNLAPASIPKGGTAFDLAIALGVLAASDRLSPAHLPATLVLGELSLDGAIHPVRGVLAVALAALRLGYRRLVVPEANLGEARVVEALRVLPVRTLPEAVDAISRPDEWPVPASAEPDAAPPGPDLADVQGQLLARRALELAAAGGHNLLFVGPPGAGKTMLARRLPGLLPPMTPDERLEASALHSIAGTLPGGSGLLVSRPFRAPHHTTSGVALVGGGAIPRPGEVTLAHRGVLLLDECPEFPRAALEALRQPLEDGAIAITRAWGTVQFPARFILVAAMNPCPCGYRGHPTRPCSCPETLVDRYARRLSGPLLDRLDLTVRMGPVPPEVLDGGPAECSATVAARVAQARARQAGRAGDRGAAVNADLRGRAVVAAARPTAAATALLRRAGDRLGLSARSYHRVLAVARTAADLDGDPQVDARHVGEALQFRTTGR